VKRDKITLIQPKDGHLGTNGDKLSFQPPAAVPFSRYFLVFRPHARVLLSLLNLAPSSLFNARFRIVRCVLATTSYTIFSGICWSAGRTYGGGKRVLSGLRRTARHNAGAGSLSIRPRKVSEYQPPHCDRPPSQPHSPFLSRSGNYSVPFAPRFSPCCGLLLSFSERELLRQSATRYRDIATDNGGVLLSFSSDCRSRSRENASYLHVGTTKTLR